MGAEVNNQANVNIGNLSDLVFDLPTERILFAVISFYGEDQNEHALRVFGGDRGGLPTGGT